MTLRAEVRQQDTRQNDAQELVRRAQLYSNPASRQTFGSPPSSPRILFTHSPKIWMDAYLAAFAIAGGLRMVTLDGDFKAFVPQGLDLVLLRS